VRGVRGGYHGVEIHHGYGVENQKSVVSTVS
jgi:hypothetical protein